MSQNQSDRNLEEILNLWETDCKNTEENDALFSEFIRSLLNGHFTNRGIAERLLVSVPTINRWAAGKNLPQLSLRKPIFRWAHSYRYTQ